jgi:peptide/nickel transport system ATP-binding protein/oligopeptide transport system ATP-binding protein
VDGHCNVEEPLLDLKAGGNLAACHYPLTDAEIRERLPTASVPAA